MRSKFAAAAWLLSLLPLAAHAAPGDSDLAQARELLSLSQSSIKDYDLLTTQGGTDPALQTQFVNYVTFAREALPALRRSAEEGNAAGQYLLAMTLRIPSVGPSEKQEAVCDLLMRSAKQNFLPAALVGPSICQEQMAPQDMQGGLKQAIEQAPRHAAYYPMQSPAYRLCVHNQRAAFPLPELTQAEFEAEAYFELARRTKAVSRRGQEERLRYLRLAMERDCEGAKSAVAALEARLKS
ncbi:MULTISPECIES: hypothetical protein [Pseudomonas]|uniref:Sel1 repeat family protein n=1 Tax=Pseudomonas nitroreducens TaxID=46680 RepID=A0A6G6IRQ1_PSENT|nr:MULTISPECIES: hypothetical protein [Pseudomonas]MDG9853726.1 hypothetical protein [Pseudomonas nitroreducens]MDH1076133.1 hypothetical protein [Pseudomonas nitroreducens]NMZ62005.1 hypothetical protein [Pseudomonas nitroreducens]NMZ74930.1 hypothetical protein [Pseudomonas nitroreducens]NNN26017.1 hypothetical protein [Pseudomonas nitroreducens]